MRSLLFLLIGCVPVAELQVTAPADTNTVFSAETLETEDLRLSVFPVDQLEDRLTSLSAPRSENGFPGLHFGFHPDSLQELGLKEGVLATASEGRPLPEGIVWNGLIPGKEAKWGERDPDNLEELFLKLPSCEIRATEIEWDQGQKVVAPLVRRPGRDARSSPSRSGCELPRRARRRTDLVDGADLDGLHR